jgi:murein DD-endopeptidase MepM/ murein hydrolase activator NlpD
VISRGIVLGFGALLLAGCARNAPPAPLVSSQPGTVGQEERQAAPAGEAVAAPGTVIVRRGDTYSEIAEAHGVSTRALIEINGAEPPYTIYPGDVLRLPPPHMYTVVKGDTATRIARCHGVDLWSLVQLNGLQRPYRLSVGQDLRIPRRIRAPHCPEEGTILVEVEITEDEDPIPAAVPAPVSTGQAESDAERVPPAVPVAPAGGELPDAVATPEPAAAARVRPPVPAPTPQTAGSSKFLWPADGQIASRFGTKSGGLKNDGINIAAPAGSPVRATADGTVAYAGNELQAYGNLVLIRHKDGWMSAYAHNQELKVARGDQVRQGQMIAQVGQTGNVPGPQVHFELRTGKGRPVDPLKHLGK